MECCIEADVNCFGNSPNRPGVPPNEVAMLCGRITNPGTHLAAQNALNTNHAFRYGHSLQLRGGWEVIWALKTKKDFPSESCFCYSL